MRKGVWKRAVLALTALCLTASATAEAESYAIPLDGCAILADAQGNELTQRDEYGVLYSLYGLPDGLCLYAGESAGQPGGYALVNAQGEALTGFEYQLLEYGGGQVMFSQGGRMGLMDTEGRILLEPAYTALSAMGGGVWLAQKTDPYDDSPDRVYRIDASGAEQETDVRISSGLGAAGNGLCPAMSAENGRMGYIGADGRWAVEPQYEWAGAFSGGFAGAGGASGAGLIDMNGQWAVKPEYEYLDYVPGGLAVCGRGDTLDVIDVETGNTIVSYRSAESLYGHSAPGGLAVIVLSGRTLAVDRTGKEVLSLERCRSFSQWGGMTEHGVAYMGDFGEASAYLYRMDGTCLAGPYQDLMPLGLMDGRMYYVYTQFETVETVYPGLDVSFWDEAPGTRRCGVLSPDGEQLCELDAQYITYLGEDRMLIEQEGSAVMTNFSGEIMKEFANSGAEDEQR